MICVLIIDKTQYLHGDNSDSFLLKICLIKQEACIQNMIFEIQDVLSGSDKYQKIQPANNYLL